MKCKTCNSRMYVKATIPSGDDQTIRFYTCPICGATMDTHEKVSNITPGTTKERIINADHNNQ